jgi:hypothetical protein
MYLRFQTRGKRGQVYRFKANLDRLLSLREIFRSVYAQSERTPALDAEFVARATQLQPACSPARLSDLAILVYLFDESLPWPEHAGWDPSHPLCTWFTPKLAGAEDSALREMLGKVDRKIRRETERAERSTVDPTTCRALAARHSRGEKSIPATSGREVLLSCFQFMRGDVQAAFGREHRLGTCAQGLVYDHDLVNDLCRGRKGREEQPHEAGSLAVADFLGSTPGQFWRFVDAGSAEHVRLFRFVTGAEVEEALRVVSERTRARFRRAWGRNPVQKLRADRSGQRVQVFAGNRDLLFSRPVLRRVLRGGAASRGKSPAARFTQALADYLLGRPVPAEFEVVLKPELDSANEQDRALYRVLEKEAPDHVGNIKLSSINSNPS